MDAAVHDATLKALPHDTQAEMGVLGSMMLHPDSLELACEHLTGESFYRLAHRDIFTAIQAVYEERRTLDIILLRAELKARGKLEAVGGPKYLTEITEAVPTSANAEHYVSIVLKQAGRRTLTEGLEKVLRKVQDPKTALSTLVHEVEQAAELARAYDGPAGALVRRLSDVQAEPLRWLWPGRVPVGKLTLLAGDPGLGKSLIALDIAARVTTGSSWPDTPGERQEPGGVVLLTAEDDLADTVRPRLDVACADCARIVALETVTDTHSDGTTKRRAFNLTADIERLEDALNQVPGVRLVIIDPLASYMGPVDSHHNAEVRAVLSPLADLAQRRRVAVLAITHLRKTGGKAIYRTMGSLAFAAAARAVLGVAPDPEDETEQRRLVLPVKMNLAPTSNGMAYTIASRVLAGVGEPPTLVWEREPIARCDVDRLLGGEGEDGRRGRPANARNAAADWLAGVLLRGPMPSERVYEEGLAAGFSKRTLERAKLSVNAVAQKTAAGAWEWLLAEDVA